MECSSELWDHERLEARSASCFRNLVFLRLCGECPGAHCQHLRSCACCSSECRPFSKFSFFRVSGECPGAQHQASGVTSMLKHGMLPVFEIRFFLRLSGECPGAHCQDSVLTRAKAWMTMSPLPAWFFFWLVRQTKNQTRKVTRNPTRNQTSNQTNWWLQLFIY